MTSSAPKPRDVYDGSTIERRRKIPLFAINYGTMQVLK
jgi:hypothetical protein